MIGRSTCIQTNGNVASVKWAQTKIWIYLIFLGAAIELTASKCKQRAAPWCSHLCASVRTHCFPVSTAFTSCDHRSVNGPIMSCRTLRFLCAYHSQSFTIVHKNMCRIQTCFISAYMNLSKQHGNVREHKGMKGCLMHIMWITAITPRHLHSYSR